jgi:NAD+ synthase
MEFHLDVMQIDPARETARVAEFLVNELRTVFRRKGIVVGLSGGIDSAVMAALAVEAVGAQRVSGLVLPERESNPISSRYAHKHAENLGIEHPEVDVTPTVDSVGGYRRRDEYIQGLIPEYTPECQYNISLPTDLLERDAYNFYVIQVQLPDGTMKKKRLTPDEFRAVTAFANIKIRSRMLHLYHEAEKRHRIVAGTTNRTEMILGDFCKYGDGGTDTEALAHLYKTQIFELGRHLDVIPEILERTPSPDTFSLPVSDQEFFFRIPFDRLDLLLYAWEHQVTAADAAEVLGLDEEAVRRVFRDFTTKNAATAHLREMPHAP